MAGIAGQFEAVPRRGAYGAAVFLHLSAVATPIADRRRAAAERGALLVLEPLVAYLRAHGLGAGELKVAPLWEGHSDVTYALRRDGAELVLRRPPLPPLPPSAHDVERKARALRALKDRARVPDVLAACADESVVGAPFYVWSGSTITW